MPTQNLAVLAQLIVGAALIVYGASALVTLWRED